MKDEGGSEVGGTAMKRDTRGDNKGQVGDAER